MTGLKQSSFSASSATDIKVRDIGRVVIVGDDPDDTILGGVVSLRSDGDVELSLDLQPFVVTALIIAFSSKQPPIVCSLSSILDVSGRQVSIVVGQISISGLSGDVKFFGGHDPSLRYVYDPTPIADTSYASARVCH